MSDQEAVAEVLREIGRLAADAGAALAPPGHAEALASSTELGRMVFHARACSLALVTEDAAGLVFVAASGAGAAEIIGTRLDLGRGIAGWVAASGQPIEVADVTRDPHFARDVAEATGYVPRCILAAPVEA